MVPCTFHLQDRYRCKDRFLGLDGLVPVDLLLVFLVLDCHFPIVDRCRDEVMFLRVCSFYNKKTKWDCSQLYSLEPFILQKTPFLNTSGSAFKDSVNDLAAKQRFGPEGSSQNVTSRKLNIHHIQRSWSFIIHRLSQESNQLPVPDIVLLVAVNLSSSQVDYFATFRYSL